MTIPHTYREMQGRAYLDAVVDGVPRLVCLSCAKDHDMEEKFRASTLRTISGQGDGGCNLCGQDVPLAEIRVPLSVIRMAGLTGRQKVPEPV